MRVGVVLVLLFLFYLDCMAQFSAEEKILINEGDRETPFRVLKITDETDYAFLRSKAQDVDMSADTTDLLLLIDRLKKTMEVESGVGIAAPQVGISRKIFIFTRVDHPDHPQVVAINPRIVGHPNEFVCFERDGCLSIPNESGNSVRFSWVDVEYTTEAGELVRERLSGYSRKDGFTGVIFQHEYDHLYGILFIDKLCQENDQL